MIRLAMEKDLPALRQVYDAARHTMQQRGNCRQWQNGYPQDTLLIRDIRLQQLYVLQDEAGIYGAFVLAVGEDPTYQIIEEGAWLQETPYMTLHRVASNGRVKKVFAQCMAYARQKTDHLRIDTHEDNHAMRHLIIQQGFHYCGVIHVADGSPRLAFEWLGCVKNGKIFSLKFTE